MARHKYQGTAQDGTGRVIESANITVYLSDGSTLATIYTVASGGTADSDSIVASNSSGWFEFYVDDSEYTPDQLFELVISKTGYESQTWENVKIIPDEPYHYYCDPTATDQGTTTSRGNRSLKDLIATITTNKYAIIRLSNSSGNTTTYTLSTSLDLSSYPYLYLEFAPGAIIQPAASKTLTVYSPEHIIASPRQQIIDITNNSTDPVAFTQKGVVRPDWFVNNATPGTTDMQAALNLANDCSASDSTIKLSGDDYAVGTRIDLEDRVLDGNGSTIIATSASMTVIRTIKRGWGIHNLTIDVAPLTFTGVALHIGAGKEDNMSNVHLRDSAYNTRTSPDNNYVIGTGTGLLLDAFTVVYDGKSVSFCNFDNITITGFYYAMRSVTTAADYAFYQGNTFNNIVIYGFVEAFKWYKWGNTMKNVIIQSSHNSKKVFDLYWSSHNNFQGQVWDWQSTYVTAWDYFGNLDDTSIENYIEVNSDLEKYPITDEGTGNLIVQANTAQENTWEVTVGSGEEFETLSAALEHLVMRQPHWRMIGRNATITLASGYELAEEIEYTGVNMGWITITGTDASHNIDRSSLTQAAFLFQDSIAPKFSDCQFGMDATGTGTDRHGIHLVNSSMHLAGDSGVSSAGGHGIYIDRMSTVQAEGPGAADVKDFSGAGASGVYMDGASRANFDNLDVSSATAYGIYVFGASYINAPDTTADSCETGIRIAYGSVANVPDSDVSGATTYGIRAGYGSMMNARSIVATGCGTAGALAEAGSTICAKSGNTQKGAGTDPSDTQVDDGAFIEFHVSTGGVNQAANTLTEEGAIFE